VWFELFDFFIDEFNINHRGFKSAPNKIGRAAYHPAVLLSVYVYVYLNQKKATRRFDNPAWFNIELM